MLKMKLGTAVDSYDKNNYAHLSSPRETPGPRPKEQPAASANVSICADSANTIVFTLKE